MGGRGGAGGGIGAGGPGRGRGMSLARFLSQQDIDRANAASVTDMGDIIRRTFERNAAEINGLELSDAEKKDAVKQMATLATTALKTAAGAVNPYASGPARLTTAQKTGSAADRAAKARGEMDSYIRRLRDQSSKNKKERLKREMIAEARKAAENKAFSNAFVAAQKSGALEVTVNGKKYRRANKRSGTWRPV